MKANKTTRIPFFTVNEPCHESWQGMAATNENNAAKHCEQCQKNVYNLEDMTQSEVAALLDSGEKPCVRYSRHANGVLKTKDTLHLYRPTYDHVMRYSKVMAVSMVMALAACSSTKHDMDTQGVVVIDDVSAQHEQQQNQPKENNEKNQKDKEAQNKPHEPFMLGKVAVPEEVFMGDIAMPEK